MDENARKPAVVKYIEENRAKGKTEQEITHNLLDAGWHMDIIRHAMQGSPIKDRGFAPILDIKKQPLKRSWVCAMALLGAFIALILLALFV
jgi:hypothetical protein